MTGNEMSREEAAMALGEFVLRFYRRLFKHGYYTVTQDFSEIVQMCLKPDVPEDFDLGRRVLAALDVLEQDALVPMEVDGNGLFEGFDNRAFKAHERELRKLDVFRVVAGASRFRLHVPAGLNVTDIEDIINIDRVDPTAFRPAEDGKRHGFE